jgi:nucleotide-binding universal stress UspA family protein
MKKILVPIDGSPASKKAALRSIEIAKDFGSSVTFISVLDIRGLYTYTEDGITLPLNYSEIVSELMKHQSKMLDDFTEKIESKGIEVEKKVISGIPSDEIIQFAGDSDTDFIVMGRRGFSKIKRFFVGSVTMKVVAEADCPVLVINDDGK